MTVVRDLAVEHANCSVGEHSNMLRVGHNDEGLALLQIQSPQKLHNLVFIRGV